MDWKIFASTFALIFLAELGDKTQLAAMAATAGSRSTFSVFLGASLALVLSTLVAVLVGEALQRVVPPSVIKGVAGALFLLFGVLLVWSAYRGEEAEAAEAPATAGGAAAYVAVEAAALFEEALAEEYAQMANTVENDVARSVLQALAAEERGHAGALRGLHKEHKEEAAALEVAAELPANVALVVGETAEAKQAFMQAIHHERQSAAFYRELARVSHLPSLRTVFARLAEDEEQHATRLEGLLDA